MYRLVGTRKTLWVALGVLAVVLVGGGIFAAVTYASFQESSAREKTASKAAKKTTNPAPKKDAVTLVANPAKTTPPHQAAKSNSLSVAAAQQKAALIEQLKQELQDALADRPMPIQEPIGKPGTMTTKEYERAKKLAESWLRRFAIEGGGSTSNPISAFQFKLLGGETRPLAEALIPKTMKAWVREGMKQEFDHLSLAAIERKATPLPAYRALLDPENRKMLKARLPWKQRSEIYGKLAAITGDPRPWSLLHPFDDLSGEEMRAALRAAEKAEASGILALTEDERDALLDADAIEYFERKLRMSSGN